MGNLISSSSSTVSAGRGGKVIMSDGSVRSFSEPVSVAELMMDHPRHFVVDARLLGNGGAKVAPLPADHMVGAGAVYVMLPAARGKVSADEARRLLLASRSLARSRSMPAMPAGLRKLSTGLARKSGKIDSNGVKHESSSSSVAAAAAAAAVDRTEEAARPDGFEEHRPEFLSRELSNRGWKPSLRTIEERVLAKKVSHWLF